MARWSAWAVEVVDAKKRSAFHVFDTEREARAFHAAREREGYTAYVWDL